MGFCVMTRQAPYYHLEYVVRLSDRWELRVIPVRDPSEAEVQAKFRRDDPKRYACVKVTGPFDHEVPE